ncbi:MAG: hypothetical protein A3G95_01210 [Flavobacteria bacterium RIFCSPLOWO2_12_FULL_31_7]|nr:MAG: hypothetical protein A3G95_01210 [Flavobacteria bacterium RIFCSPLOWO2_12_FULL_31_7]
MKKYLYILFLTLSQVVVSQNDSILKGKIIVETNDNEGITIVNISNKTNTISGSGGYFKIKAKANDTIMFSAIHLVGKKHIVTKRDFGKDLLFIKLEIYTRHIKEIMVTNADDINAESLGLVPKGQKKYTPAERRVKTAGDWSGTGIDGALLSLDPLLNAISGRTKQLKAELEVERKEFLQSKIYANFDSEFIMNQLHIPEEYIEGYVFYIVEDAELKAAAKAKNKTLINFRMSALAVEYLKLKNLQPYYPKPVETEKITEEKTENTTIIKPETEPKKDE